MFPSTGTSDEAMYLYCCEISLPKSEIDALNNQKMGSTYEFERITTQIFTFEKAHQMINNTNGLLLNYLYLAHIEDWALLKKLKLN